MSNKINAITNKITNANNLDELLAALREADLILKTADCDLTQTRLEDLVDLTSLPNCGGVEPADTSGVWSWDAQRLLVGDADWEIVSRDDE
jgi:hypothetical protein